MVSLQGTYIKANEKKLQQFLERWHHDFFSIAVWSRPENNQKIKGPYEAMQKLIKTWVAGDIFSWGPTISADIKGKKASCSKWVHCDKTRNYWKLRKFLFYKL